MGIFHALLKKGLVGASRETGRSALSVRPGLKYAKGMVTTKPVSARAKPELLAPAGDWECARAAVANGADAVYFGLPAFNARMRATNFTADDLPRLMTFLHEHGVKGYVAFNVLIFTNELAAAEEQLILLQRAGVDAAIVQDVGLAALARDVVPDFHIHASTQMTLTSPEGLAFAHRIGVKRAVLARELSLRELAKFRATEETARTPLEVFVHGALCVAYSGQCLTSEALGQRSANRGECAQACRMPYELVVDGITRDLGDRRYLLSPQDLAAVAEIPELVRLGVASFKIEGRLKTPEYVASVTQVYRRAIDRAWEARDVGLETDDRYRLEMAFSRGLYSGWMHGVNHQKLVHARFGKKRGALVGTVTSVGRDFLEVSGTVPVRPGDGLVIDSGGDTDQEQGGRVYEVSPRGEGTMRLAFEHGKIDFANVHVGNRLWKTDDPQLNRQLRKSFEGGLPKPRGGLALAVTGAAGEPLRIEGRIAEGSATVSSVLPLQVAQKRPLTDESLRDQLGRLGETVYRLQAMQNQLRGEVIIPVSELNRLRRELVAKLDEIRSRAEKPTANPARIFPAVANKLTNLDRMRNESRSREERAPKLTVLCRDLEQIAVALRAGVSEIYADFEDIRRYRDAVELTRSTGAVTPIFLATPRIQKAGEQGFFQLIENARPDGVLIRNLGALDHFKQRALRRIGDFSLNVANPLTAELLMGEGLERLTISYDLNAGQALDLLRAAPPWWFELTLHQHIPMFHMEHCVFAAFLSEGTDHTNCGRPCDRHRVELRDRVGLAHPLKADVGCRNTLFHAQAQSGAVYFAEFLALRPAAFRVELLLENPDESERLLRGYRRLLAGEITGSGLVRELNLRNQLGVTRGTLAMSANDDR
jgi:putative protease